MFARAPLTAPKGASPAVPRGDGVEVRNLDLGKKVRIRACGRFLLLVFCLFTPCVTILRGSEAVSGSSPGEQRGEPDIRLGGVGEALLNALSEDAVPSAMGAVAAVASSSSAYSPGVSMEVLMAQVAQLTACVIQLTELQRGPAVAVAACAAAAAPEAHHPLAPAVAAPLSAAGGYEAAPMDTSAETEAHIEQRPRPISSMLPKVESSRRRSWQSFGLRVQRSARG